MNSDPNILRLWVKFLGTYFGIEDEAFRVGVFIHTDHETPVAEAASYWTSTLGLPATCLIRPVVDKRPRSSKRLRLGIHKYGVCSVAVHRTDVVQHIYGAIQEYGGFDRASWIE